MIKCLFCSLFNSTLIFFHSFVLFVCDLQFKITPKYSAAVLSCYPKHRKAVMSLVEKYVLDKFYVGMSYHAVGFEFSVGESVTYLRRCLSTDRHIAGDYTLGDCSVMTRDL